MKGLKIYLGIMSALLLCAIGFGVYVWYTIQKVHKSVEEQKVLVDVAEVTTVTREMRAQ